MTTEGPGLCDGWHVSQVVLEKFKIANRKALADGLAQELAGGVTADVFLDHMTRRMVLELRAYIPGERLDKIEIRYPADWWQALKERWFPAWALKKWPVRYHQERWEINAYYPKLQLPHEEHYIRVHHSREGGGKR